MRRKRKDLHSQLKVLWGVRREAKSDIRSKRKRISELKSQIKQESKRLKDLKPKIGNLVQEKRHIMNRIQFTKKSIAIKVRIPGNSERSAIECIQHDYPTVKVTTSLTLIVDVGIEVCADFEHESESFIDPRVSMLTPSEFYSLVSKAIHTRVSYPRPPNTREVHLVPLCTVYKSIREYACLEYQNIGEHQIECMGEERWVWNCPIEITMCFIDPST